jgi:hypothetical protein
MMTIRELRERLSEFNQDLPIGLCVYRNAFYPHGEEGVSRQLQFREVIMAFSEGMEKVLMIQQGTPSGVLGEEILSPVAIRERSTLNE